MLRLSLLMLLLLLAGCTHAPVKILSQEPTVDPVKGRWRAISLSDSRVVANEPRRHKGLAELARRASLTAVEETGAGIVAPEEIWTSIIDLRDSRDPRIGSYQGDIPVYPASVVKICYMVAAYDQHRTGLLDMDMALRRDIRDMIVVSDNRATNRVLDRLANTGYGPELGEDAFDSFFHKRRIVTRYMQELGLDGLWAVSKTYDGGIRFYGRDPQMLGSRLGDNFEYSNRLTTDDNARLLYLLWRRAVVDREACEEMLELMRRDGDSRTFFSRATPPGATLYSKGGSTNICRHDAGIFQLPDGGAVILVVYTFNRYEEGPPPRVLEHVASIVLDEMMADDGQWDQQTAEDPFAESTE